MARRRKRDEGCGCLILVGVVGAVVVFRAYPALLTGLIWGSIGVAILLLIFVLMRGASSSRALLGRTLGEIDRMPGLEFEQYLAAVLESQGWSVTNIRDRGDFGADLIATKGSLRFAIQAKRLSGNVSNSAVQEARAGADYHSCPHAAVATQSFFTGPAKEQAGRMNPPVILVDRRTLHRIGSVLESNVSA